MASKRVTKNEANEALRAALDVGNGECAGVSNERPYDALTFQPLVAPMTKKRGLNAAEERPTFSLLVDKKPYVYGVDDVMTHGNRDAARVLNSLTRYGDPDYTHLVDVLLLNLFGRHRGTPDRISPALAINVPVIEYQKEGVVEELRSSISGNRDIRDYESCVLQVNVDPAKVLILPESVGALMHWATDPRTLARRDGVNTAGVNIVVDVGYLTTDTTYFEGMKFVRDSAFTLNAAGMQNVVNEVNAYLIQQHGLTEQTAHILDRALRPLAGQPLGAEKFVKLPHGEYEVTEAYDAAIDNLASRIAQFIQTHYRENTTRVLLAGGGAYHLLTPLKDKLPAQFGDVVRVPDAALANVYGAYTTLQKQEKRG